MSGARDNGGPAFPSHEAGTSDPRNQISGGGMSLRDYFAIRCLPISRSTFPDGIDGGWEALAAHAYKLADAMLAAREAQ